MIAGGELKKQKPGDGSRYGKSHKRGEMNQTESEFADLLDLQVISGLIVGWLFEPLTITYAPDGRYTPDFMVWNSELRITMIDVKGAGPENEASTVRMKACAEKFPCFLFAKFKRVGSGKNRTWKATMIETTVQRQGRIKKISG